MADRAVEGRGGRDEGGGGGGGGGKSANSYPKKASIPVINRLKSGGDSEYLLENGKPNGKDDLNGEIGHINRKKAQIEEFLVPFHNTSKQYYRKRKVGNNYFNKSESAEQNDKASISTDIYRTDDLYIMKN